jgi:hypothetical protein
MVLRQNLGRISWRQTDYLNKIIHYLDKIIHYLDKIIHYLDKNIHYLDKICIYLDRKKHNMLGSPAASSELVDYDVSA